MESNLQTDRTWLGIVDDLPTIPLRWRETERLEGYDEHEKKKRLVRATWCADLALTIHARIDYHDDREKPYSTLVVWDGHTRTFATTSVEDLGAAKISVGLAVKLLLAELIFDITRVPADARPPSTEAGDLESCAYATVPGMRPVDTPE